MKTIKDVKTEVLKELNRMYRNKPQEYLPCPNCGMMILGKIRLNTHLKFCEA